MFRDFLHAAKSSERLVEHKRFGGQVSPEQMADTTDKVWLAYQVMDAFCPRDLVVAAKNYIDTIWAEFNSDAPGEAVGRLMTPARERLTEQARLAFSEHE